MAVTAYWYQKAFSRAFGGITEGETALPIDLLTDTIKVMLTTSPYTPNQDTHDFVNDVTNEVTGTGYTAGGATLGAKSVVDTNNVTKFDAADTSWATSTITARRAVIYKDSGTPSTSPLLAWVDFGADVSSSAGTFQITWDSAGILTITATDATGFP